MKTGTVILVIGSVIIAGGLITGFVIYNKKRKPAQKTGDSDFPPYPVSSKTIIGKSPSNLNNYGMKATVAGKVAGMNVMEEEIKPAEGPSVNDTTKQIKALINAIVNNPSRFASFANKNLTSTERAKLALLSSLSAEQLATPIVRDFINKVYKSFLINY